MYNITGFPVLLAGEGSWGSGELILQERRVKFRVKGLLLLDQF